MIVVRQIQPGEGPALRSIRLRALRDTPDAFGTSLAETLAQTAEEWAARATRDAAGETSVLYVAEDAGAWIGIAGGILETPPPEQVAQLVSMWVDPAYRGRGLGRQLVERVADWAGARGVRRLELWVTAHNSAAMALYTQCGFRTTGESQPHPGDATFTERKMARDL